MILNREAFAWTEWTSNN